MYPTWLMTWMARMRRTWFWETAPRTPRNMVNPAEMANRGSTTSRASPAANTRGKVRSTAYTPILVSSPLNRAAIETGNVWYVSGNQNQRGKNAPLRPNTMRRRTDRPVKPVGSGTPASVRSATIRARSAMFSVPVIP